jgi:hypothetical protein
MDEAHCAGEFIKLAKRLGIEIRQTTDGPSGLCTIKGKRVFFIDKSMNLKSLISLFASELKTLDTLGDVFIVPMLRKQMGIEDDTPE